MTTEHTTYGERGPQGDHGQAGDQGHSGRAGERGPQGDFGQAGTTGPAGAVGAIGITGAPGLPGERGPTGDHGQVGDTGPIGATGVTGHTGPAGSTGPTGQMGERGEPGNDGLLDRARGLTLGAFIVAMALGGAFLLQRQAAATHDLVREVQTQEYEQCLLRQAAVIQINASWDSFAVIEQHNPDEKLRNERLAVFQAAKLDPVVCTK